jgi:hypothetical protein
MTLRASLAPLLIAFAVPGCLANSDGLDDGSSNRGADALTVCPGPSVEGVDAPNTRATSTGTPSTPRAAPSRSSG